MAQGDFSLTVTADVSDVLRKLAGLQQPAQQAGTAVGKGLGDGIGSASKTIDALTAQLLRLQQQRAKLQVDSSEYKQTEQQIAAVKTLMADLRNQKVLLQADASQIDKAANALGDLGREADTNTNRFGLLDGAVAGVAATLSSAVLTGAQSAISAVGSLINQFGSLDTEIRKAASAAGEEGGYDKIARTVDQVGIEAAGTSLEVAQLATELVRGGMTIDEANDSLGAIVRGAEATGTQFSTMGSVVSATLKGFGLEASKATTVVDALVQGANASATDVTGMGNAMKYAAPVARILGVDVQGLGTAIGLLSNAGIDASEAGVTLRNGLSKLAMAAPRAGGKVQELSGQAKIAADTMKQLNIDIYNTDGTLKPMETTLLELKRAFEKLDPASKIRLASNLFGGEDDGTKWLAMLSQSETDIRKMSDAMNNSEGATDKARTAMQGFQLKMAQLQGTLDSIGTGIGKVAAMALTPLVDIVNQAIGAFAALPTPVKDFLSAVALLTGGVATATAAFVVFKTALQTAVVQSAITGVGQLAVGIGTTLVGAVKGVVAVIPGLLTQLSLLGQVNVATAMGTIATTLRSTFLTAVGAAATAVSKFVVYLTSVSFASLVSGIGRFVTAIAPLALAIGAVTLAVTTWQTILSGAKQVQSDFADAQDKATTAADKLKIALKDQATEATNAKNAWQTFLDYAKESLALGELQKQFGSLQAKFTAVQMEAARFYTTIRDNETLTSEEAQRANGLVAALRSQAEVMTTLISAFKKKAKQAEADGNTDLAQAYLSRAGALGVELEANNNLISAYDTKLGKQGQLQVAAQTEITLTDQQKKAIEALKTAEENLNTVLAEAPVRNLADQITVGQQLATLVGAISQLEQSRYSVTRSQLDYELTKAKERGASENTINTIKRKIDTLDANALSARYKALQLEQTLQLALLQLTQQKAMAEANIEVLNARKTALQAEAKISKATNADDRRTAQAEKTLAEAMVGIAIQKRDLLIKTQPIERAIAAANDETADNAERAKAAAMGYQISADGSLTKVKGLATEIGKVTTLTADSAREVGTYQRLATAAGLAVSQAKDGTIILGQRWQDVNDEVNTLNTGIDGASGKTGAVKSGADGIKSALQQALGPAAGVVSAFVSAGEEAPGAVTAAKGFSSSLSVAAQASSAIRNIRLDTYMGNISSSTNSAASAAQSFYGWLQKAASLPVARWTGGPVEGGETYRVNELGQEALLSGGRLSLINAPSGGMWRAPSTGVVVPAGITAELQARGALPVRAARLTGGGSAIAEQAAVGAQQAVVLGKLEAAVDRLSRKDWNVNVTMRQGPTGSQVIKHLNRLL